MLSNLELTALVAMAAAFVVSFIIMVVLYVTLSREKRKVAELNKQLQNEEASIHEVVSRTNFEIKKEQAHRIKVLEGMVASQQKSMADLRDAIRRKAFDSAFTRGGSTEEIVAAAKKFERYLRGKE